MKWFRLSTVSFMTCHKAVFAILDGLNIYRKRGLSVF